ncbi:MAG TPA: PVC-type heme-binding CxxCH protein, partial [Urbifossiella sp.]|nr:PVC-type heme-binding CxxCH protein [Urbifossiella sp.]
MKSIFSLGILAVCSVASRAEEPPRSADPRLVVELFAAAPDIVHPIAMDFDSKGRLLVVESHTHFRPKNYKGPKHDRIRVLEDTDGDGKADKFTTFYEGTTATMDLAVHFDGSVYLAARNEIIRLRDTDGDGKADEKTRIVFLDTAGNYPHNGLSGLSFNFQGDLVFGMGENLGASYKLVGNGTTIADTEGGKVFTCTADGKDLRRIATGFWNPFGSCHDIFGRLFVVDNDPDSSPPCRLVHVVEGGDYGFQFRYGRAGRHVFQAWNGELPGTLPYVCGTGESPCEVISYESDGLPAEYRGNLLVPAWADHRVERYVLKPRGASFGADRKPFIQGGKEFRPSGMSVAPDGSLFVSDWVSRSYELHGKGAVWHVRMKDAIPRARPTDAKDAILSLDRKTRETAARELAKDERGRAALREQLASNITRFRATAFSALVDADYRADDARALLGKPTNDSLRAMAARAMAAHRSNVAEFLKEQYPASIRAAAVTGFHDNLGLSPYRAMLTDSDPFLRHAAIVRQSRSPIPPDDASARERLSFLLAARGSDPRYAVRKKLLNDYLHDPDPDVRFLAVKWVSDEKVTEFQPRVGTMFREPKIDPRLFVALATALARLDDKPVNDDGLADYFLGKLSDKTAARAVRLMAVRSIPAAYKKLRSDQLAAMLSEDDADFRIEVLRALKDRGDAKAAAAVTAILKDAKHPVAVRAQAILTLSAIKPDTALFQELAGSGGAVVAAEAKRALADRTNLKPAAGRPPATDTEAWLKRLDGPFDAETGRRIFENTKLANCSSCHRVDGRGANVGPDLSLIGRTERKWIVESILQPSAVVAPHFQTWKIETADGKAFTGLLVHTNLDESFYLNEKGQRVRVLATELLEASPLKTSIMPDGL